MGIKKVILNTGEQLVVKVLEPPLTEYSKVSPDGRLVNWVWSEIRDELLAGDMNEWLYTPYAIGLIGGKIVGSASYYSSRKNPDIGLIEFVETLEEHRGKGVASALISALVNDFNGRDGLALYLCTTNPIAARVYEKHGFWYSIGDGLRYLSPRAADFDDTYFSYQSEAYVREATWTDLPGISALYNSGCPSWLLKDYLSSTFRAMRYESHFVKLRRRVEDSRGGFLVLENRVGRIVGAAVFERLNTFQEQHVATASFLVTPAYVHQTKMLLDAVSNKAIELSIGILQIYVGEHDEDQIDLIRKSGYLEEARLDSRFRDDDGFIDMLIYSRKLVGNPSPVWDVGNYYGGRTSWIRDRLDSIQDS